MCSCPTARPMRKPIDSLFGRLALLVWGDPALYDSSLRIAERLQAGGLPLRVRVVPGLTSLQLLTAA
ncbi:MAG: hypothetical protein IOB81_25890, partial [Burkholderia sp.]|nr:hypothetical protein [Burkholderia sp.]